MLGDSPQTALISMKATQLKISRKWNSIMMGIKLQGKNGLFTPPTYSHIYNLKLFRCQMTKEHGLVGKYLKLVRLRSRCLWNCKIFCEQVGKGDVEVKHGSDESKTDSPY